MYQLCQVSRHPGFYYFSRWSKGGVAPFVTNLPKSFGEWKHKFVFISDHGYPHRAFTTPHKPSRPELTSDEKDRVDFSLDSNPIRSYDCLIKTQTAPTGQMVRLNIPRNPEREAALLAEKRKKLEMTHSTGVASGSGASKPQEVDIGDLVESEPQGSVRDAEKPPPKKKPRLVGGTGEFAAGKFEKVVTRSGAAKGADGYAPFFHEVRAALEATGPSDRSDIAKRFCASFSQTVRALYNTFLTIVDLSKEMEELVSMTSECESRVVELEKEKEALELRLAASESQASLLEKEKNEAEKLEELMMGTCSSLHSQLDEVQKGFEQTLATTKRRIESLTEDLDAAKRGYGVDYDLITLAPEFEPIRDAIEQIAGESVLQLIKSKYPDLDYFL